MAASLPRPTPLTKILFPLVMAQSTAVSHILSLSSQTAEVFGVANEDRPIRKVCKACTMQMICGILIFFTLIPSLALVMVVIIQGLRAKRSYGPYAKKGMKVC